jgi:hypothetical protein
MDFNVGVFCKKETHTLENERMQNFFAAAFFRYFSMRGMLSEGRVK